MTKSNAMTTLAAGLLVCGAAFASIDETHVTECAEGAIECPTGKKIAGLLTDWEAANKEAASITPEAKAAFSAKIAECASKCPVGSRLGDTVATVNDVIGFVVASANANAENCPLEKAENQGESCAEAKAMKGYRTQALAGLQKLSSFTANATCEGVTECADAASKVAAEGETCDAMNSSCPIKLASRIGELKASFAQARREATELTTAQREEILASFGELSRHSKAVMLVPQSVATLAEGLEVLNGLHTKMVEWGQANPEIMKQLPESAMRSFMMEVALIDEARALLESVTATMNIMQPQVASTESNDATASKG